MDGVFCFGGFEPIAEELSTVVKCYAGAFGHYVQGNPVLPMKMGTGDALYHKNEGRFLCNMLKSA